VIELAASLEATGLATALRKSVWVYPLVSAGHILGIALLLGSVIPMDVALLRHGQDRYAGARRFYAVAGLVLAALCGGLLFAVQATDYLRNPWFLAKIGLLVAALLVAALYLSGISRGMPRRVAAASLLLWLAVLICGRLIGFR
jgi:peptidoglycan/LPS O-acetylase OafA/YrhL